MSLSSINSTDDLTTNNTNYTKQIKTNKQTVPNKEASKYGNQQTNDNDSSSDESEFHTFFKETTGMRQRKRARQNLPASDSDSTSGSSKSNQHEDPRTTRQASRSDETSTLNPNDEEYCISTASSTTPQTNITRHTNRTKSNDSRPADDGDHQFKPAIQTKDRTIQQWIMDGIRWIRCKPIAIDDNDDSDESGDDSSDKSSDGTTEPSTRRTNKTNDEPVINHHIGDSNTANTTNKQQPNRRTTSRAPIASIDDTNDSDEPGDESHHRSSDGTTEPSKRRTNKSNDEPETNHHTGDSNTKTIKNKNQPDRRTTRSESADSNIIGTTQTLAPQPQQNPNGRAPATEGTPLNPYYQHQEARSNNSTPPNSTTQTITPAETRQTYNATAWKELFDNYRQRQPNKTTDTITPKTTLQPLLTRRTDNQPIGDAMTPDEDNNIFRIYFQNINGLNVGKGTGKFEGILSTANNNNVSVMGLAETNTEWNNPRLTSRIKAKLRQQSNHAHMTTSTSAIKVTSYY